MTTLKTLNLSNTVVNPDLVPIQQRSRIDINISEFDLSASGYSEAVKLNYEKKEIVIVDSLDPNLVTGSLYYTPLYTEKIDYNVWKTEINKSFQELEVG
jgi:hypothetical protein